MNGAKCDVITQTRQFLVVLEKLSEPNQAALARFLASELPRLEQDFHAVKRRAEAQAQAALHTSRHS